MRERRSAGTSCGLCTRAAADADLDDVRHRGKAEEGMEKRKDCTEAL
jgi:hypothetical protein